MDLSAVVVSLATVFLLVILLIRKRYSLWKDMGAPYEEPDIPHGSLKGVGTKINLGGRMQELYRKYKRSSPFVGIYIFFKPAALILDLDLVKNILIKDFNHFHDRGVFYNEKDDPISAHLFAMHGSKWRLLRNKLSPTFTSGKMKIMFPTITAVAKRFEAKIKEISQKNEDVDIKKLMARFTTDVIGTVAFGIECNSLDDENSEFFRMGQRVFGNPRHSFVFELFLLSFRSWAQKLGAKRFRDDVAAFFTNVVNSTVNYRVSNDVHRNDFMDLLIGLRQTESDDKITFNELLAQAFVFFVAGFETSSSLLQFCFYELAANAEIQDKLRNHINQVLAKHDGELTYEAMLDMKYLDQVLNETLRLYPPVTSLIRETDKDYPVPGTQFKFPKGTTIIIPTYAIQRDPEIYPNPDEFNPDNCFEEKMKERPSVTFLPFGEGPRICIGARFGMMQARVAVIAALRNFRYTLSDRVERPLRLSPDGLITTAVGGIWLRVEALNELATVK